MFVGKASSLTYSEALRLSLALITNIKLGWKGLPGTKTLAYYENFSLQDKPWAEFSTLEVAAACIPCTYCPVLQYNLT
jgi:hypothetical protein